MGYRPIDDIDASLKSSGPDKTDYYDTSVKLLGVSRTQVESITALIESSRIQNEKIDTLAKATENLLEETKLQGKSSSRLTKTSLILSILAVLLAGTAVWFAARDSVSDREWMEEQVSVLKSIYQEISPISDDSDQ